MSAPGTTDAQPGPTAEATPAELLHPRRIRRVYLASLWVGLVLVWGSWAQSENNLQQSFRTQLRQSMQRDLLLLEDQASRALDAGSSRLDSLAAVSTTASLAGLRRRPEQLHASGLDDELVPSLSLLDARGRVLASTDLQAIGTVLDLPSGGLPDDGRRDVGLGTGSDLQVAHLFAVRRSADSKGPAAGALQAEARLGPALDWWMERRMVMDGATYRWVARIDSEHFIRFWRRVQPRQGESISLRTLEGAQIVALGTQSQDEDVLEASLADRLSRRPLGDFDIGAGASRHVVYRASLNHPVVLVLHADLDTLWAARGPERHRPLAVAGTVTALLLLAWGLLFRSHLRHERSLAELARQTERLQRETRARQRLEVLNASLLNEVTTDPMTGIANRRGFAQYVQAVTGPEVGHGAPLALLMLDIDHFKSVNDTYGHAAGDELLKAMARLWSSTLRGSDLIARLGGEEFCVVLPNTTPQAATLVANKLREATQGARLPVAHGDQVVQLQVTVSIGVASESDDRMAVVTDMQQRADEALYAAKRGGRNQVVQA